MTGEEKKPRRKRTKEEIAAEKKAWLMRHEWAGPKRAHQLVFQASKDLEEAQAACGGLVTEASPMWRTVQSALTNLDTAIVKAIPPDAN